MITIAIALVIVIVVSVFAYLQQRPEDQSSELFTLRPVFFTLPDTYFNIPSSFPSMTLYLLLGNYLLGNYTNLVFAFNYSGLQFNTSSSSAYAFNILGEQKYSGSGPFILSSYMYNSSGWFAQAGFYIDCMPQILKTVKVSGLAGANNDQIIVSNNKLTVKQSGITLINDYSLPTNFYVDSALSGGSPNSWLSGNVYGILTGKVPFNSATAETSRSLEATSASPPDVNLDGNLQTQLSTAQTNLIWAGTQVNEIGNWFAGDQGTSTAVFGYNFSAPQNPFGTCDINFVNASGNRPFPYMSYSNYAIPKIYYSSADNLVVHFDIKMLNFTTQDFMRTAVVVELVDSFGQPYYFELDIKDGGNVTLPYINSEGGVWEQAYINVAIGPWVHFDIPFNAFINTYASQIGKNCFIEAFYLVNECYGSGYVSYDVTNWELTI